MTLFDVVEVPVRDLRGAAQRLTDVANRRDAFIAFPTPGLPGAVALPDGVAFARRKRAVQTAHAPPHLAANEGVEVQLDAAFFSGRRCDRSQNHVAAVPGHDRRRAVGVEPGVLVEPKLTSGAPIHLIGRPRSLGPLAQHPTHRVPTGEPLRTSAPKHERTKECRQFRDRGRRHRRVGPLDRVVQMVRCEARSAPHVAVARGVSPKRFRDQVGHDDIRAFRRNLVDHGHSRSPLLSEGRACHRAAPPEGEQREGDEKSLHRLSFPVCAAPGWGSKNNWPCLLTCSDLSAKKLSFRADSSQQDQRPRQNGRSSFQTSHRLQA